MVWLDKTKKRKERREIEEVMRRYGKGDKILEKGGDTR
jgi:hypothetical protein